jgi:hypothetical protein
MTDAGIPMPALVSSMPMPSYDSILIKSIYLQDFTFKNVKKINN